MFSSKMNISKVKMSQSLNPFCVFSLFLLVASETAFALRQSSSSAMDYAGTAQLVASNNTFLKAFILRKNESLGAQAFKMSLHSLKMEHVRDDKRDLKSSNVEILRSVLKVASRPTKKRISLKPPKNEARKKVSSLFASSDVLSQVTQPVNSAYMLNHLVGRSLMRGRNLKRFPRAASKISSVGDRDDDMTILLDNVNVTQLNHSREVDQHETMLDAEVLDLFGPEPETSSPFLVNYPLESGHTKDRPLLEQTTRLNGNFSFRAHTNQNGSSSDTAEHDVPNEEWEIPMQSMSSPSGNVDSAQDYYSDYQSGQSSVHEPQKCAGTENVIPPNWLEMNDLCEGDLSRWSCNQRCSQFGDWDFFGFTCSCHPNCVMHNFCCSDFETECPLEFQEAMNARKKFPDTSASCDPVLGSHVISTCPAGASEVEKTLCEGDWEVSLDLEKEVTLEDHTFTNSSATAILRETRRPNQAVERLKREAPVSDPVLGWHFKNRFCWRCWKMKNPPVMWRIDILISAESRPAEDYRLDTMTDYAEHHRDMISWHPPPPLVRAPCSSLFKEKVQLYEDVTAWCTACQVDQATQEACVNGSASYLRIGAELYKNHHCFLCSKFYHSEKLSSPQNHDHLLPVTIESEQKHFCYTVEFFNDLAYHNMFFPVTMILPDEHNGGVEFIQKADNFGAFTWDKLQCKNTGTESEDPSCVAEKCSDTAILVNDKCDNSYYPRKAIIRICVADPKNDHISCQPNQQETTALQDEEKGHGHNHREASLSRVTFKKRFGTDLEQVREKFVIMGSHFGAKHFGNFSLMQASIDDDPREGLLVFLVWKMKKVAYAYAFDILDKTVEEEFEWMAYSQLETVRIAEPVIICITWSLGADKPGKTIDASVLSCNLLLPCGVNEDGNPATFIPGPGSFGGGVAGSQICVRMIYDHILCILLGMIIAAWIEGKFL